MDHADDGGDNDVFVYMGGDQRVPRDVRYVRVHKSVKVIRASAFCDCEHLVSIEMHDGVEIIEEDAFLGCRSLRSIKLPGVRVIGEMAFDECRALTEVEFGNKLDTIGREAFDRTSLRNIKIPKVRVIGARAFFGCEQLTGVELSKDLETIGGRALGDCRRLRRITMPLKDDMFDEIDDDFHVFHNCGDLSQVDLVGGIHKTVSSLLLESRRNEMNDEIDRINQDLPNTPTIDKTWVIRRWMERVIRRIEHYKSEHYTLLKEFTTLLELALWKAKLDEEFGEFLSREDNTRAKKAKIDMKALRQEKRITSGANIVIKNVLPFLKLE
jgi:hypothetical protein